MLGNAHFSAQFLFVVALIDNLTIFDINNYSVFTFTKVIIPFGLTRDLIVFAVSSATIFSITSKSLINKIFICTFHVTHFSSTTKFLLQNQTFLSYKCVHLFINCSMLQSNLLNKIALFFFLRLCIWPLTRKFPLGLLNKYYLITVLLKCSWNLKGCQYHPR